MNTEGNHKTMSTSLQLPLLPSERIQQSFNKSLDYKTKSDVVKKDEEKLFDQSENCEGSDRNARQIGSSLNVLQNLNHERKNETRSTSDINADLSLQYEKDRKERTECIEKIIHTRLGSSLSLSEPTPSSQQMQQRLSSSKLVPPLLNFIQTTTDYMNRISSEANEKLSSCSYSLDRIDRELNIIEERIDSVQFLSEKEPRSL